MNTRNTDLPTITGSANLEKVVHATLLATFDPNIEPIAQSGAKRLHEVNKITSRDRRGEANHHDGS